MGSIIPPEMGSVPSSSLHLSSHRTLLVYVLVYNSVVLRSPQEADSRPLVPEPGLPGSLLKIWKPQTLDLAGLR